MKEPLWQRRRRRPARDDGDGGPAPEDESPRTGTPRHPDEIRARLRDSQPTHLADSLPPNDPSEDPAADAERQAAYAAWADRMKNHKKKKLADLAPDPADEAQRPTEPSPYWDVSNLFHHEPEPEITDPPMMETRRLLAVLEIDEGADGREVQVAYRRLAKQHHPDRWLEAPDDVRAFHAERMAYIAEVHAELRRRLS